MNIHDQWSDDHWFLFCQKTGKNGGEETVITRRIKKGGLLTCRIRGLCRILIRVLFLQYDLTANTECSDADDYPDNPYRCCFYLHHRRFCGLLYAICSSSNKRINNRSKITVQFFRCIFFPFFNHQNTISTKLPEI